MENQNNGTIKISEDVIATIAITSAQEIDGVFKVSQRISSAAKNVIGQIKASSKGVSVVTTDNGLDLTLQITVKNGFRIPDVAASVQKNVSEAVSNMTGLVVSHVNVIVGNIVEEKEAEKEKAKTE